jgi:Fe-S-cluster containining protein
MTNKKQCTSCGACCEVLASPIKGMDKDDIEYLRARGLKEEQGFFLLPHTCAQLGLYKRNVPTEEGREYDRYCIIHDHKPKTCRNFKGKKAHAGKLYYVPDCCTMKE